jgi:CheY-like chemotaxis protein
MQQGRKNKILLIDDSLTARRLIIELLPRDRFEVFEAADGATGLATAAEIQPDLILLDYVMPKMNGYEVFQSLRAQPRFAHVPIIIISSNYDEVVKRFGYPFVGFDFVHKQAIATQLETQMSAALMMTLKQSDLGVLLNRLEQLEERLTIGQTQLQESVAPLPKLLECFITLEQGIVTLARSDPAIARYSERGSTPTLTPHSLPILLHLVRLQSQFSRFTAFRLTAYYWLSLILVAFAAAIVGALVGTLVQPRSILPTSTVNDQTLIHSQEHR